jgi:hypothetical protein
MFELSAALIGLYGADYIAHPRLRKLAERNRITMTDFLDGAEEALAHHRGDHAAIQRSTIRKVHILGDFILLTATNKLKTDKWRQNLVAWLARNQWPKFVIVVARYLLG